MRKDIRLYLFNLVIPFPPPAEGNLIPCSSVVHPFHLVDCVPDAEGEPGPDEEAEELADSHDARHLPEWSTEQTVTDDDDVAQDGERRPQGEP